MTTTQTQQTNMQRAKEIIIGLDRHNRLLECDGEFVVSILKYEILLMELKCKTPQTLPRIKEIVQGLETTKSVKPSDVQFVSEILKVQVMMTQLNPLNSTTTPRTLEMLRNLPTASLETDIKPVIPKV